MRIRPLFVCVMLVCICMLLRNFINVRTNTSIISKHQHVRTHGDKDMTNDVTRLRIDVRHKLKTTNEHDENRSYDVNVVTHDENRSYDVNVVTHDENRPYDVNVVAHDENRTYDVNVVTHDENRTYDVNVVTHDENRTYDVNVVVTIGDCNGLQFPIDIVQPGTWFPLDSERSAYMLSAYWIRSRNRIFIIGARVRKDKLVAICQLWHYDNNSSVVLMETSKASISMPSEGPKHYKYTSTIIECPISNIDTIPTHVSLATTRCQTPLNLLIVHDVTAPVVYIYNFTVCLSPLFYHFNEANKLIEWIELNRLLGADQFIVYNHSVDVNVEHVLRYYSQRGLVKVVQWRPPMRVNTKLKTHTPEIHYFGQTAALNDCLFRSKASSEFLVNLDLDEFIIPHIDNITDWSTLIKTIGTQTVKSYKFRSTFFSVDETLTENNTQTKHTDERVLITLQSLHRERKILPRNQRTKYIMRTSGADRILTHYVPYVHEIVAPEETGLVHHYRLWERKDNKRPVSKTYDNTVKQRYGEKLVKNVRNVWKELTNAT